MPSQPPAAGTDAELLSMFTLMVRIRALEELAVALRRADRITGTVHPCTGHEAIAAGAAAALAPGDAVVSYYRCHGHALAKGVPPRLIFAELFGSPAGLCGGHSGSMHLVDMSRRFIGGNSIVGPPVALAAGVAAAYELDGGGVAVGFFGDGAMGTGVAHETLMAARAQHLPVVLVCENNGYQDHTPTATAFGFTDVAPIPQALGIWTRTVDGNQVTEVAAVLRRALGRARAGLGPSFVQAMTFLRDFHAITAPADVPEYRSPRELARRQRTDPVLRTWRELAARTGPEALAEITRRAHAEMAAAAAWAQRQVRDEPRGRPAAPDPEAGTSTTPAPPNPEAGTSTTPAAPGPISNHGGPEDRPPAGGHTSSPHPAPEPA